MHNSIYGSVGNRKVAIIGAGFVGSSVAYALALRDITREIVLIDINVDKTVGEAFDIRQRIREKWSPEEYRLFFDDVEKMRDILNSL